MVIEISILIIALAFVALVIGIIVLIKSLSRTLYQVDQTLIGVRKQIDDLGGQVVKVIEHTNQISVDLKRKMESLNSIFNTVSNVGDFLEQKTFVLKKEAFKEERFSYDGTSAPERETIKAADILELVDIGLRLWQKIKKRR